MCIRDRDTYELEKARGITIFSKQAEFSLGDCGITLLDTPGHVDFSPEMERTLQVLDYAVLVISAADGVQGQVRILWKLLKRYGIPVFLFINKMDQPGTDREAVLQQLRQELDGRCMDFGADLRGEQQQEDLAVCEEGLLERYLDGEPVRASDIRKLIRERKVFPCYFGSALKMQGVDQFLDGLREYMQCLPCPGEFGARVFKISRDGQGDVYKRQIQWNSATAPISFKKPPRSLKIALNRKKISRSGRSKIVKSSLIMGTPFL